MVHLAAANGIAGLFVDTGLYTLRWMMVGSFGALVVAAVQFATAFVEPGKLQPWHRRIVDVASIAMVAATLLHAAGFAALGTVPATLFFSLGGALGLAFLVMVVGALRRGSTAILFPLVAFSPLAVIAGSRVVTFLLPGVPTVDLNPAFVIAALLEVAVTTVAVAARFAALRSQRDDARAEADMLERLAGHDALTGLRNRRAIEPSFSELYGAGFTSFALFDLDHFEQVNDQHGHATGDEVLRAAASALQPDDDTLAIRMGGEEFLLLARGAGAAERIEARRKAIAVHVAAQVPSVSQPVTASAGLVELPSDGARNFSFDATYAHVDRLLYEAKQTGRDRTVAERMSVFTPSARSAQAMPSRAAA